MSFAPAVSTANQIRTKVRRLTASPGESVLTTDTLDEYINTFYTQDFPYAIKLDQTRQVYSFFTSPNVDRYPLNVNTNMGVRAPIYFEGVEGFFYKDRQQFYNLFPRWPTRFQQSGSGLEGVVTGATQANPCVITSPSHDLTTNDIITFQDVGGMVELNGNSYGVIVIDANTFSIDVDSTGFGAYTSGGTYSGRSRTFTFTVGTSPILATMVVLGGTDFYGNPIKITDDGGRDTTNGSLLFLTSNDVGDLVPPIPPTSPIPPAFPTPSNAIGSVNYVTATMSFTLPVPLAEGTTMNIWVTQYSPARPYSLLFWNNEFIVRPIPDGVYKVEVETYLSPMQFIEATDNPILRQWWQYIAYGAAMEIMRDRNDFEAVDQLREGFLRQEGLVLERQGVEEIGQRNSTVFSASAPVPGWNAGQWWY